MQDPPPFPHLTKPNFTFPEQEQLKCPRCDSTNTKFCYYNNYNLSQPRHFCKTCRRYWTKGGALRNIPVGGGTRKNISSSKRSSSSSTSTPSPSSSDDPVANPNSSSKRLHTPPDPTQLHHTPPFMGLAPSSAGSVPITTGFLDHPITQMTVDDATTTNTTGGFISMFNSPTTHHQHQHPQMIGNLNFLHGLNHGGGAPMVIPSARIFSTASTNTSTSTTTQNYPIPTPDFNLTGSDQSTTHNRDTNSNHPDLLQRISTNDEAGRDLSSSEGFYRSIQQLQQNGWPGGGLTINTTTTTTTPPSSSRRPPTQ